MFDLSRALPPANGVGLKGLPAAARAVGLIAGAIRQMSMDAWSGDVKLPRPHLLEKPDRIANTGRAWWIGTQVEDYLWHGNAVHVVTHRDEDGWPDSVQWVPAENVSISADGDGLPVYWIDGEPVRNQADVVHVRRGAARGAPWRGVGVLEQHLAAADKLMKQAQAESDGYDQSGVPSVVIVAPNKDLSQEEADRAKDSWMEKFRRRVPAVMPAGTEVKPLSWSPSDAQMVEAHQASLQDVANMFGLDGSYLGASLKGMAYKSLGRQFLQLVRETIDPITDDFEQVWSEAWFGWPLYDKVIRFDKSEYLADDPATETPWLVSAVDAGIISTDEARVRLGFPSRKDGL